MKKTSAAIFLILFLLILLRGYSMGEEMSIKDRLIAGAIFPSETKILPDYAFKDGDIAVIYRPSCSDCQRYILKIRRILRGKGAIYLTEKNAPVPTSWVPSVMVYENGEAKIIEIKNKRDLEFLKRVLRGQTWTKR